MKTLLEKLNPKKVALVFGAIMLFLILNRLISTSGKTEELLPEEKIKAVEVIRFGHWSPEGQREITGILLSGTDVNIRAEVSGTIEKSFVTIGDNVKEGQALATFRRHNDATQISYENLIQQLTVAKIQASSSIQSAETALATAERQLKETERSETQNYSRTFDLLKTQARNAESEFRNIVDWADERLMVSNIARASANYSSQQIGRNNTILRQKLKNNVEELLRKRDHIDNERLPKNMNDEEVLRLANDRLQLLRDAQSFSRKFNTLVQGTPVTGSFPQVSKTSYENEATGFVASVDGKLLALEGQIESAKSEQGRNRLSVLGVENSVQNLEAGLSVARAQAKSQVTQIETQLRLARSSQSDLTVRAPFSGTITGKNILPFDQVKTGDELFSLVGKNIEPRLSTTITRDELMRMQAHPDQIQAALGDGTIISLPTLQISGKLDAMTQKLKVDFPLNEVPEKVLVGSFVKILLPIDGIVQNLLPISAISFEPDGEEVLILQDGKGLRVKITAGKIISNAVEVLSGLEVGNTVVQYRNRAHAGENLEIRIK